MMDLIWLLVVVVVGDREMMTMSEWFVNQRMRDGWEGSEIKAGD